MVFHRPSMGQGRLQIISRLIMVQSATFFLWWLAQSSGESVSEIQASRGKYYSYESD